MYRLLLKTHNKIGLKYLCFTEKDDYIKYLGSGKYWKRYLKQYGKDISTDLLYETEDLERFKDVAIVESIMRDIVKSEEYANLKIEEGDGGNYWGGKKRPEHSKWMKDHNIIPPNSKGKKSPSTTKRLLENNPMNNPISRQKVSTSKLGKKRKPFSEEHKKNLSFAARRYYNSFRI